MELKKYILLTILCLAFTTSLFAQKDSINDAERLEKRVENLERIVGRLNNVRITGYFQPQFISAQKDANLRIGTANENPDKGFNRVGIRRGRIKTTYEEGLAAVVFQMDMTERAVGIRDAYLKIKDPWFKTSFLQTGLFFRPFGHEIGYSSSRRESPERSRIITTLFPNERDLGVSIQFRTKEGVPLDIFSLETALVAGNGIAMENNSRRDFIGHLTASPKIGNNASLTVGTSYYLGSVYQGTENVYRMQDGGFVLNSDRGNMGRFARREYLGFDLQASWLNSFGRTQVRAEYIFGQQPGSQNSSVSPNSSVTLSNDTYLRNFLGGYAILIQDIGKLPFEAILKYDWYDPNTKVSGNAIGLNGTTEADIRYNALAFGGIWHAYKNVELQAYYEILRNEKTNNLTRFTNDLKDNTFTVTLQYRY
ncbi:phosphate-selective porin [Dysgonomonas alginatilytica]|uniref:Phosphate-selective porin n=1 Tax=Dysgonomonas alginatilytica TaxID=1605892 RepID=A0A2V3PQX6_9BACT|nr:hypothetical protein [Dysgonomonas alginatilytica]PXV66794.1 phosphate-selective porin [Dysgonomonas alginatilytica]